MPMMDIATVCSEFEATLNRVIEGKERVILTHEGKPIAVLAPAEELHRLEPDADWQQRLAEFVARIRSRIPEGVTPEEIEADITAASEEVRQERLARSR
jgi:prevent-host-death family protein